jgi:ABC-type sugar transport system permease subunit
MSVKRGSIIQEIPLHRRICCSPHQPLTHGTYRSPSLRPPKGRSLPLSEKWTKRFRSVEPTAEAGKRGILTVLLQVFRLNESERSTLYSRNRFKRVCRLQSHEYVVQFVLLLIVGPDWLGNTRIALLSVALVDVWKGVGIATVIFIAGIMSIPEEYFEALMMDGGNGFHKFWNIILPLSRPAMNSVIILAFIGGLRSFDLIWSMTKGGPGFSTDLIASIIYKQYQGGFYGLSTAGNVILFVVVSALAFPLYA